jgi:hypothetical protein
MAIRRAAVPGMISEDNRCHIRFNAKYYVWQLFPNRMYRMQVLFSPSLQTFQNIDYQLYNVDNL